METSLIICTPGLEKELLREIREVWPYLLAADATPQTLPFPEVELIRGGVEIPCSFFTAVQFNFFLKTATRVLWRLQAFRCRDFPKLFQSFQRIPWQQWLSTQNIEFHVSAAGSRLNHEKRIEETATKALSGVKLPVDPSKKHNIYIRIFKDDVTVSLDLSGEPLYKRIANKKTGEAPFRETWANFVLRRLLKDTPLAEAASITLVDPFMGSGTFLMEALTYQYLNFRRAFAYKDLVRAPKLFKSENFHHNYKWNSFPVFKNVFGSDKEPKMLQVAQENLISTSQAFGEKFSATLMAQEALNPTSVVQGPLWLVANPPWGTRLAQHDSFEALCQGLTAAWKPARMALVLPSESLNPSCISTDYKVSEKLGLEFGGQSIDLWIFDCKK